MNGSKSVNQSADFDVVVAVHLTPTVGLGNNACAWWWSGSQAGVCEFDVLSLLVVRALVDGPRMVACWLRGLGGKQSELK